ncbi:hypothetical protein K502DRAFT_349915 [Neoconidiobolus thromboides FSU 785]|nr:hypothetical protein K502DRAFT_349915 [Neoconidiobolus thromboides FSU 785]
MKFLALIPLFAIKVYCATTANSDLNSVISATNQVDQKSNRMAVSSSNNQEKIIVSNLVAPSKVSLGKHAGIYRLGVSSYPVCKEGLMFCDYYSYGFWTCAQGRFVFRNCGPGTKCVQHNGNLYCDYA